MRTTTASNTINFRDTIDFHKALKKEIGRLEKELEPDHLFRMAGGKMSQRMMLYVCSKMRAAGINVQFMHYHEGFIEEYLVALNEKGLREPGRMESVVIANNNGHFLLVNVLQDYDGIIHFYIVDSTNYTVTIRQCVGDVARKSMHHSEKYDIQENIKKGVRDRKIKIYYMTSVHEKGDKKAPYSIVQVQNGMKGCGYYALDFMLKLQQMEPLTFFVRDLPNMADNTEGHIPVSHPDHPSNENCSGRPIAWDEAPAELLYNTQSVSQLRAWHDRNIGGDYVGERSRKNKIDAIVRYAPENGDKGRKKAVNCRILQCAKGIIKWVKKCLNEEREGKVEWDSVFPRNLALWDKLEDFVGGGILETKFGKDYIKDWLENTMMLPNKHMLDKFNKKSVLAIFNHKEIGSYLKNKSLFPVGMTPLEAVVDPDFRGIVVSSNPKSSQKKKRKGSAGESEGLLLIRRLLGLGICQLAWFLSPEFRLNLRERGVWQVKKINSALVYPKIRELARTGGNHFEEVMALGYDIGDLFDAHVPVRDIIALRGSAATKEYVEYNARDLFAINYTKENLVEACVSEAVLKNAEDKYEKELAEAVGYVCVETVTSLAKGVLGESLGGAEQHGQIGMGAAQEPQVSSKQVLGQGEGKKRNLAPPAPSDEPEISLLAQKAERHTRKKGAGQSFSTFALNAARSWHPGQEDLSGALGRGSLGLFAESAMMGVRKSYDDHILSSNARDVGGSWLKALVAMS